MAAAAHALRALQRDVGILQRVGRAAVMLDQAHEAQRGRDLHVLSFDRERRREQVLQRGRVDQVGLAQQGEDVAADARQRQARVEALAQAAGHRDEQRVAELVAERIVGFGKLVDVDEAQRGVDPRLQAFADEFDETGAVRQGGQRVVERGALQVRHQRHVVEADGDAAREHVDEAAPQLIEGPREAQPGAEVGVGLAAEVQGDVVVAVQVAPLGQRLGDGGARAGRVRRQVAVAHVGRGRAAAGQHLPRPLRRTGRAGAQQAVGILAGQHGHFAEDARRHFADRMQRHQFGVRAHDFSQARAAVLEGVDLFVGADRRGDAGVELGPREFGLGAVIVDVVATDGVHFRRVAGLARAQDDAHVVAGERVAHVAHEVQAGVGLFHHHVEQDDGDVGFARQYLYRFGGGMRVQEGQGAPVDLETAERERRRRMHVRIVVDDQHAPRVRAAMRRDCRRLVREHQVIVLRGARGRVRCGHLLRLQ